VARKTFRRAPWSALREMGSVPKAMTPYAALRYRDDALTPEIVDLRMADVEAIARWLDYAFALPGGFQFGVAGAASFVGREHKQSGTVSMRLRVHEVTCRIATV